MKALKAVVKPFEAPQRSVKIKIQLNFYFNTTFRNARDVNSYLYYSSNLTSLRCHKTKLEVCKYNKDIRRKSRFYNVAFMKWKIENFSIMDSKKTIQLMSENLSLFNPLSASPTKWSNTLKQFVGKLPMNCLSAWPFCGVGT